MKKTLLLILAFVQGMSLFGAASLEHDMIVPGNEGASILASANMLGKSNLSRMKIGGNDFTDMYQEIENNLREYIGAGDVSGAKDYLNRLFTIASPQAKYILLKIIRGQRLYI